MESKIRAQINQLRDVLPTVDYLASAVKNQQMANAVAGICSEISHYLYEVIAYFKKPSLRKLAGSLVANFESKFGKHVSAIQSHTTTIRNLQSTANLAASLETINKLDQSTQSKRMCSLLSTSVLYLLLQSYTKCSENAKRQ
jgi:hypothetical protein